MSAAGVLKAVPDNVWFIGAAALGIWWGWRQVKGPLSSVGNALGAVVDGVGNAVGAVVEGVGTAGDNIAGAVEGGMRSNSTVRRQMLGRFGLVPAPQYDKDGDIWRGYDKKQAERDAQAAANSQIAKDIQKYGGGYGALTK